MSVTLISGSSTTNNAVTNPNNVLVLDGSTAVLDHDADWLEVTGFSYTGTNLARVLIRVDGMRDDVANGQVIVSYKISGVPTGITKTLKFTSPSTTIKYIDITNDRAWTDTDIQSLSVRFEGEGLGGNKAVGLDYVGIEATSSTNTVLSTEGQFKRFFVNSSAVHIVQTPGGNDHFKVKIRNLDNNTQKLFIYHNNTASAENGWELLPAEAETWECKGNTDFYAFFDGNIVEEISVSLHEVT